MNQKTLSVILLGASLSATGCYTTATDAEAEDEVGGISEALELDDGGYDMGDELAAFGVEDTFSELQLLEPDLELEDPMEATAEVVAMRGAPDAVAYMVAIQWGQIPGDRTNRVARDWSGILHVNRGAIIPRRTVRFEGRTDNLLPRRSPQNLPFTSVTLPHHDGLILTVIDPNPTAAEPLVLSYVADLPGPAGSEGGVLHVPLRALVDHPRELFSDRANNRMVAVAHARPVDVCNHGFLMGRWHRVDERHGRFLGRVVGERGGLRGHVRGIYGVRRSGERVFFGKYIDTEGRFRGIFRGTYGDGEFRGRWVNRAGDAGVLGGQYREQIPGPETGGHFMGRWGETTCNLRL